MDNRACQERRGVAGPWALEVIMSELSNNNATRSDDSDDEWIKEESAIFEMLDHLDESFSATSRADQSTADSSFGEMSFGEGDLEVFRGG
jgi:hypothetical protein